LVPIYLTDTVNLKSSGYLKPHLMIGYHMDIVTLLAERLGQSKNSDRRTPTGGKWTSRNHCNA
jgi:hypothetical protein